MVVLGGGRDSYETPCIVVVRLAKNIERHQLDIVSIIQTMKQYHSAATDESSQILSNIIINQLINLYGKLYLIL